MNSDDSREMEYEHWESLGEKLLARREALGISLHDLAGELQTSQAFLKALEDDRLDFFPAKVYARGFLKKVLRVLAPDNEKELVQEFEQQWDGVEQSKKYKHAYISGTTYWGPVVTPKRLAFFAVFLAVGILGTLLGVQLTNFIQPPQLTFKEFPDDVVLEVPQLAVRGSVDRESKLTVNGREIRIDEAGNFDELIELLAGANRLEFLVQNRFGKESTITKYVVVR